MEETKNIHYSTPEVVDFNWMGVLGHSTNGTSAAHAGGSNCSQGSMLILIVKQMAEMLIIVPGRVML